MISGHMILLCPKTTLHNNFLEGLHLVLRSKWQYGVQILILEFAHSKPDTFGLLISWDKTQQLPAKLYPGDIQVMVTGAETESWPHITLFSTSCFSGGWVTTSMLQDEGPVVCLRLRLYGDSYPCRLYSRKLDVFSFWSGSRIYLYICCSQAIALRSRPPTTTSKSQATHLSESGGRYQVDLV